MKQDKQECQYSLNSISSDFDEPSVIKVQKTDTTLFRQIMKGKQYFLDTETSMSLKFIRGGEDYQMLQLAICEVDFDVPDPEPAVIFNEVFKVPNVDAEVLKLTGYT